MKKSHKNRIRDADYDSKPLHSPFSSALFHNDFGMIQTFVYLHTFLVCGFVTY